MSEGSIPDGQRISVHDGVVVVTQRRALDQKEVDPFLATLDAWLVRHRLTRVLFDTRLHTTPPREVTELYWTWAQKGQHHERVALLVKSELKRVEGTMTAISKRVQLRSFTEEEEAFRWLRR